VSKDRVTQSRRVRRENPASSFADAKGGTLRPLDDALNVEPQETAVPFHQTPVDHDRIDIFRAGRLHHRGLDNRQRRDIGVVGPYQNEIRATVAVRSGLSLNELR
jgi:hypothetical protein